MRIENEMLNRFNKTQVTDGRSELSISGELDFFFENVMDTVVDFFKEREELTV